MTYGGAAEARRLRTIHDGPRQTERDFLAQVVEAARLFHWEVYHPFLSKWSQRGFPDLTLVRPPRIIFAELKSPTGRVTPDQQRWIDLLNACPGVEAQVWFPEQLDEIVAALR